MPIIQQQSNDKKKPKVSQQQVTVSNLLKEFRTSVDQLNTLLAENEEAQKIKNSYLNLQKESNEKEFQLNTKLLAFKKESANELRNMQFKCENKIREVTQEMETLKQNNSTLSEKVANLEGKIRILNTKIEGLLKNIEQLSEQLQGRLSIIESQKANLEESLKSFDEINCRKQDLEMELSNKKVSLAMEVEDKERIVDVLIEVSKKYLKKKSDVKSAINTVINSDTKSSLIQKLTSTGFVIG